MAHDVFISHSAKDKVIADAVCAAFEAEGIRCWIAPRDVMPGLEWGRSIIDAIEQSRIMLLIFTANSNASPQIRREIERAADHDVVILPFRVEDIEPDKSLEYFIGNVHWLDAMTPPLEKHIERLVGTVKVLLAQMQSREARSGPQQQQPTPTVASKAEVLAPAAVPANATPVSCPAATETTPSIVARVSPVKGRKSGPWRAWLFVALGGLVLIIASAATYFFLRPTVAGMHWVARNSGTTTAGFTSVFATSDGEHIWTVGDNGTIVGSDDKGATWTARNSGTSYSLTSVFGTSDGKRLWVAGENLGKETGEILESDDSGTTWHVSQGNVPYELTSIFGTSNGEHLWAVGSSFASSSSAILESDDWGGTWAVRKVLESLVLFSISGTSDGRRLWVLGGPGGQAGILVSQDGGATWTVCSRQTDLNPVSMFVSSDGQHLRVASLRFTSGVIWQSDDGGATWWDRLTNPVTEDLFSIFGTSDGIHLWAVGLKGTIMQSDDGSATWSLRNSGSTKELNAIFGSADGKHLWAVGDGGTILESDSGS